MAQIALAEAGAALGARLLPGGVSLLGRQIAGAAIGRSLGTLAGGAIDRAVFSEQIEGPRLDALHVMESREGAGVANIYGRMRVGGQVIWAGGFKEHRRRESSGKGGPSVTSYSYTASFAVAVCEGPGAHISRIWANGEDLDLTGLVWRSYDGSEVQDPDPLIEAIEGAGAVPAYRGIAYVVFEDLPLERFGNRLPQLSFEVERTPSREGPMALAEHVRAVNIIPASGEFVYATEPVRERTFPGRERALNVNTAEGRADFEVSLDQLQDGLPNVDAASLVVAWMGDDLRAGQCRIRPGVETRERAMVPWEWRAGDVGRDAAYLISQTAGGDAHYGGTPDERSTVQAIAALKARGLAVTLTPFILMDVPPGNGLTDPYGGSEQAPFPWRGRIRAMADKSVSTRSEVEAFLGTASPGDFEIVGETVHYSGPAEAWGYRRFILHLAHLAKAAGGVAAFLIGSEMRGLTRLRDETGAFPFVEGLCVLADEVKAILGDQTDVSYAADWSEYGALAPGDGSGDILFPLDALWGRASVDFVGIDWYPPAGDWRDGEAHLDWQSGFRAPDEADYLRSNFEGGQDFDWYYADSAARDAQERTPIEDTAHGEHWVFRAKDLAGWWNTAHHERPGGARSGQPTAWQPGSKPIRLSEIGFPAVDKGGNAPNLFYDPKSSESALPPYSSGARDDVFQRRALIAALDHWQAKPFIESAVVWAWDGRPFPAWPVREDVWSDGPNWTLGHWLNGRTGLSPLGDVIEDLAVRAGIALESGLIDAVVEGYRLDGVTQLRAALQPLLLAFGLDAVEEAGALGLRQQAGKRPVSLAHARLAGEGVDFTQAGLENRPARLLLSYADSANAYLPAIAEAREAGEDIRQAVSVTLPLAMSAPQAGLLARRLLDGARALRTARLSLPSGTGPVVPGQVLELEADATHWRVTDISQSAAKDLTLAEAQPIGTVRRAIDTPGVPRPAAGLATPDLLVIDAPRLPGSPDDPRPLVAVFADPWPGDVTVLAGADVTQLSERALALEPALTGRLLAPLPPGPDGRWDRASELHVEMAGDELFSAARLSVLAGENSLLVDTGAGWELLSFQAAEPMGANTFVLRTLLRGLQGSEPAMQAGAPEGASCVLVDARLIRGELQPGEIGASLVWRAGLTGEAAAQGFQDVQGRPWGVGKLHIAGGELHWVPRDPAYEAGWNGPEPELAHSFDIAFDLGAGFGASERIATMAHPVPAGAIAGRVRQIGAAGRTGPWVTIVL